MKNKKWALDLQIAASWESRKWDRSAHFFRVTRLCCQLGPRIAPGLRQDYQIPTSDFPLVKHPNYTTFPSQSTISTHVHPAPLIGRRICNFVLTRQAEPEPFSKSSTKQSILYTTTTRNNPPSSIRTLSISMHTLLKLQNNFQEKSWIVSSYRNVPHKYSLKVQTRYTMNDQSNKTWQ